MYALETTETNQRIETKIVEKPQPDIVDGEVLIKSSYTSLNYKDALGITGKGKIFKGFPKIGGIDVSGTIAKSKHKKFREGDEVLITGCGLGEIHDGGYSEYVKFNAENVILLPKGLSLKDVMILGTAGFTAALCYIRMKQNGQTPQMGSIAVTGASGGVGVFAILIFNLMGFETVAVTGKKELHSFLISLGAKKAVSFEDLNLGSRPLEQVKFGGAIDNLGGRVLAALTRHIELWGNIACVGLAENHEYTSSVMPLILRGVSLLGISSNNCVLELRNQIWQKLANELKPILLNNIVTQTGKLSDLPKLANDMLQRKTYGRTLIKCEV